MSLSLITGGARSGKSRFAEKLAISICPQKDRRCYIATAEPFDCEMATRIKHHQESRGDSFQTIEEPLNLSRAIETASQNSDVILIECLTVWLGNLIFHHPNQTSFSEVDSFLTALKACKVPIVAVTNETGMGLVPTDPESRIFRDVAGRLNQELASIADTVVFMVCGLPIYAKGKAL